MSTANPIVNIAELTEESHGGGGRFAARSLRLSRALGAEQLGYRLTRVAPGHSAWPFHRHHANEEMLFILNGTGTLRLDAERRPVRAGDVVALVAGGPAHELINDGESELEYLAVSTMREPDVLEYPDSDKVGMIAGSAPGGRGDARTLTFFAPRGAGVDYWDGETEVKP